MYDGDILLSFFEKCDDLAGSSLTKRHPDMF